jgi:hypothetical protein
MSCVFSEPGILAVTSSSREVGGIKTAPIARLATTARARRIEFKANGCRDIMYSRSVGRRNRMGRLSLPDPRKRLLK